MTRPDWKAQAIANKLPEGAASILRNPAGADVESPLVRHLRKLDVFALDDRHCLVEPLRLSPFGWRVLLYLDNSPHAAQDSPPLEIDKNNPMRIRLLKAVAILSILTVIGGACLAIYSMLAGLFPFGLLAFGTADFTSYPWPGMIAAGMGTMALGWGMLFLIGRAMPDEHDHTPS